MARAENAEIIDRFEEFYRSYYRNEIGELAQKYPNEQKSLYVDWNDLYRFDPDIADDFIAQPQQMREYAEEALRLYDLPIDVKLGSAHVRVRSLSEKTGIRAIRADHVGNLVSVQGIVRKATDVRPKMQQAAFECQRCGTMTRIPQSDGDFQEPHECQGCERQGPFQINFDQSEFVDSQKIRVQESPEGLRGGETPQAIDVNIEDDITGHVTAGDHVTVSGILRLEQQGNQQEKSAIFDFYMDGMSVAIEDEQFEEMDITEEDKKQIIELSNEPDIYEQMVASMAPSIYGYEKQKQAIILQLFSGVRKNLPDGSRIRGDLHILLIGDPGTGKCLKGDSKVTLADGREREIRSLVEERLDDPTPIDDGVYDETDIPLPSMDTDGRITERRATRVWKREAPDRMYRVRMASGKEVEVTPSHPLFVGSDGRIEAVEAADLREGAFIATPRSLSTRADDTLAVDYRASRANNAIRLDLPNTWTPWLARFVGYVVAEGHVRVTDDHSADVRVTNADAEILTDVADTFDRLGLNYTTEDGREEHSASIVRSSSSELASFLEGVEPAILERSADQRVPDDILGASADIQRAFLRAYVDAETHVSADQRELSVASTSRELLEGVESLLLSVGVSASITPRENGSYRLRIGGDDFERYVSRVGFVTGRKTTAAAAVADVESNPNRDVVPDVGAALKKVRETLALSQSECGLPRSTYQHYERGDRNPSRESLRHVVTAFEDRLDWLRETKARVEDGNWSDIQAVRGELGLSQHDLAERMGVTQGSVSYYERNEAVPDGGGTTAAKNAVLDRIDEGLAAADRTASLRRLAESDVRWDRIESIDAVAPDYEWVYDLEVEGTHSYISDNVVSHNSQILQYVKKLSPRSVYTSGKGSSSAGLCVTGDTTIQTSDGFVPIRDLVTDELPEPVETETRVPKSIELQTFDRDAGEMAPVDSSHVWRMPEKPCRRLETSHGKTLEASVNTPVLVCGERGIEWRAIGDVESGDYIASPKYDGIERQEPSVREYLELTTEKVRLAEQSIEFLRTSLTETFGTLRDAAEELGLSEDFIYLHLKNRHVPLDKLDRMLDAVDATRDAVEFERLMVRHGSSITVPETFDDELLYLLGLVVGDGDIRVNRRDGNRGMVRLSNGNETLLERAADIFESKFDIRPEIERQEERVPCIRVSNVTIARLFANAGMETPKEELSLASELTVAADADAFLRGLMDADGSVSVRENGGSSVLLSTISEPLAEQVQSMLETYDIRASRRTRDRRGTYELADGREIETKHTQEFVEIYGADIDRYASTIGFESERKRAALETATTTDRRQAEMLPVSSALTAVDGAAGAYHSNVRRGDNPSRERAAAMLSDIDLGGVEPTVRETVDADLRWDEVTVAEDTGSKELFDLTVPDTNNFVGNGLITHNTAAAVRDDFGEGQQWTLEAGALVLADQGVAAIDELDKMDANDQSAMHQALEQQEISISKAGINATLKSRCSLLGAANPVHGRFDEYEAMAEQIDLDPPLISRFDLIFTVTDKPNEEEDRALADHIIETNYAGELFTHHENMATPNVSGDQVDSVGEDVEPTIDTELLRKYVAHAKRSCFPTMTEEAKQAIREFYVDLRLDGEGNDNPIPITARKLEALVRLAEASARVRLSDTVEEQDADRVIDIVRSSLEDVGVDPETGEFDADIIESGTSKSQRDRIKNIKGIINELEDEYEDGAPVEEVYERADAVGMERSKAEHEIEKLRNRGELYEPATDHLRTV